MSSQLETVASLGEFELISLITRNLTQPPAVSVGPGDDAAVFLVNGSAVTSVDMLVEGVHFRRDWCSGADVGRKAVGANVADLEAMGAVPVAMVVGLSIPGELELSWVKEFMTGLRDEANLAGVALVGGDITAGQQVVVSVTVVGQTDAVEPVLRSGARPSDVVAVRGRLGWAAAGLAALTRGFRSPRAAVEAYRYPQVPYGAGRAAAQAGATAMLDVSDGLLADLGHVAQASQVCIDVESARLNIGEPVLTVATALNQDPLSFVLGGGEDHSLVATFPLGSVPAQWEVVGVVNPLGDDGPQVSVDGSPWHGPTGWQHFTS